jgi:hypothetical protein
MGKLSRAMMVYVLLMMVPLAVGLIAQARVARAFDQYKKVRATSGVTGAEAAREILRASDIDDVEVVEINGFLGDHYDPTHKRLCLTRDVYRNPSVAALGIAAHEVGHAIQHAKAYAPLKWRMAVVPLTQVASQLLPFVFLGAVVFKMTGLIALGIGCYLVITLFQLITLPVEFDASRRAKLILPRMGMIQAGEEARGVDRVLDAAALTYVAALVAALANLIWLILARRN